MKTCPKCLHKTLKVVRGNSEVIGDVLHIIREYQCVNPDCGYKYISTEKVSDGAPRCRMPKYLKKFIRE